MKSLDQIEILALAREFMESRVLLSGAELDLFTLLAQAALTVPEIAKKLKADPRGLTILLDALSALGFLIKKNQSYQCPLPISSLLSADAPESILPVLLHMANVWKRWANLTEIVRSGLIAEPVTLRPPEDLRAFIGAMHVIASPMTQRIVAAVQPHENRSLLDIGGAMGTYTVAFLRAVPEMRATLFDKPEVIEIARHHLEKMGLLHRVSLVPGDFYTDEFPKGHDLAFVSAIIHQNSPEQNLNLFFKVFRSLEPGGRIVIRDFIMKPDRIRPGAGAIFALNMLVSTPGGKTYTLKEIKSGLRQAGFRNIRLLQTGKEMDSLVEGFKS